MRKDVKVIGVSGVARAGKDTFASILINQLKQAGKTVRRVALADPLKADFDEFCQKNFGFSSFTQVPEEKLLIRPALVWYGDAQRKRTNGRHWIDAAQRTIDSCSEDYVVVTDVRYDHYERDEVYWVRHECNAPLIHISQFSWDVPVTTKVSVPQRIKRFVPPANDHEMLNDPKVRKQATHIVEWERVSVLTSDELLSHPVMLAHVQPILDEILTTEKILARAY